MDKLLMIARVRLRSLLFDVDLAKIPCLTKTDGEKQLMISDIQTFFCLAVRFAGYKVLRNRPSSNLILEIPFSKSPTSLLSSSHLWVISGLNQANLNIFDEYID